MQVSILIVFILAVIYSVWHLQKKKEIITGLTQQRVHEILAQLITFYQVLNEEDQTKFKERVLHFLSRVRITGVKTKVDDTDRVLIAASAIIPIFNFPGWEYRNLHEVLLYPGSFDHDYKQQGIGRNVLGMVGSGAMNHVMILSQPELRQEFLNKTGKDNTAIHEFVHLVDKSDGDVDGIPEALLHKKYIIPWLQLMSKEIERIKDSRSDINPYGAANEAEFFAVASEYFFERPDLLKEKHPELYSMLQRIFSIPSKS